MSAVADRIGELIESYGLSSVIGGLREAVSEKVSDSDEETSAALERVARRLDRATLEADNAGL